MPQYRSMPYNFLLLTLIPNNGKTSERSSFPFKKKLLNVLASIVHETQKRNVKTILSLSFFLPRYFISPKLVLFFRRYYILFLPQNYYASILILRQTQSTTRENHYDKNLFTNHYPWKRTLSLFIDPRRQHSTDDFTNNDFRPVLKYLDGLVTKIMIVGKRVTTKNRPR